MKPLFKVMLFSTLAGFLLQCEEEQAVYVNIPDHAFLMALIEEGVNMNEDSLISFA